MLKLKKIFTFCQSHDFVCSIHSGKCIELAVHSNSPSLLAFRKIYSGDNLSLVIDTAYEEMVKGIWK